jgi:thiopeptide-type bacteriocin biosynthesis protein
LLPVATAAGSAEHGLLSEAVFLASRQAGAAILDTDHAGARFPVVLRAYEIRARTRPTPHGAFAGVAAVAFAPESARLCLGERHTARTYPAADWLSEIVTRVLDDPGVFSALTVTTSSLVARRGSRYEVDRPGPAGHERVTVRATAAVTGVLARCVTAMPVAQVLEETTARWHSTPDTATAMLRALVRGGFLLSDMVAADATNDPLGRILDRLPADHPLAGPVAALRALLADADRRVPGDPARLAALRTARQTADGLAPVERCLAVDVRADARLRLPSALADQAAQAASVLWRTRPRRGDPFAGWHARFLERYGPGRAVPLLEAIDPVTGLGTDMPADDEQVDPVRQAALLRLITDAVAEARLERVLDPATIRALEGPSDTVNGECLPPRTADILVRILGDGTGGHFLAVGGTAADAGSTWGRFTRLVPRPLADDTDEDAGSIAELLVAPAGRSSAALAPPAGQARLHIPVGVPGGEGGLHPRELLLVSDGRQLTIWSPRLDRRVIPVLYSRLSPHLLPPLARFLQTAGHAASSPLRPWSWGAAGLGPFQPRLRFGPTVLAPARWVLPTTLVDASRDPDGWSGALAGWRSRARPAPPPVVVLDDADRRLPLDLDRCDDREFLRRCVRRGVRAVTEEPGGSDAVQSVVPGPQGDHVLEVIVPLRRRSPPPSPKRPATTARRGDGGLHLPGGRWLSVVIPAPAPCQDDVLTEIAAVAAEVDNYVERWFWLRYTTAAHGPHLRVRFHGVPASLGGQVLPAVAVSCARMNAARLCGRLAVEPYDQEIERYGGAEAITAAEAVFAADSRLVLTILAATTDPDERLLAAALTAATIARTVAASDRGALAGRSVTRDVRPRLATLRPRARAAAPGPIPYADTSAVTGLHDALVAYRDLLPPARRTACASVLIHMHAIRLLGDAVLEPIARALAADLLAPR